MQNNAKPIPPWHRPNGHEPHSSTNPWSSYRPSIASSSFQQMDLFYEQTAGPLPRDLLYPWFWRNSMTKLLIYGRVRTGHTKNADLRPNLCSATLWAPCQDNSSSNTCIHSPQHWWHTPAYTHPASRQLPLETWNWTFFSYIIVLSLFIIII